MADHKYRVLRHMQGDKDYVPGDTRVASPGEVAHLVPHALEDLGPVKAKAEDAPANKAEGDSPSNKAEPKAGKSKGAAE